MAHALILTYHAVEVGPPPLAISPTLFEAHLDAIASSGVRAVTISELAERLSERDEPLVALTFDDGFASVAECAAPLLTERGLVATVYCVAGHLGGRSNWPTARPGGWESDLLSSSQVRALHAAGWEIGSHGFVHAPIAHLHGEGLEREIAQSKDVLEGLLGSAVRSFALPYGARALPDGRRLLERCYTSVCTTKPARVESDADLRSLPRVDSHYLRRPELLRRAVGGSLRPYLAARSIGSRARRLVRRDYVRP